MNKVPITLSRAPLFRSLNVFSLSHVGDRGGPLNLSQHKELVLG